MFVRFKTLTIEGFRTFATKQTFLLDRPAGVYLLTGINEAEPELESNGIGKSTLPGDALCWLLFDKTTRGLHGPPVVSWFPHDKTQVESEIDIDDEPTTIKRTQAPNSLSLNDKKVVNEDIIQAIKIDYDQALASVILGQLRNSFLDFTPKAKLELLSSILGLDLWEKCSDTASQQNDSLLKKIQKLESEEQSLKDQTLQLIGTLNRITERSLKFVDDQRQKIKKLHDETKSAERSLQELKNQTSKSEISELEKELAGAEDKQTSETSYLEKLKDAVNLTTLAKQKIENERNRLSKEYKKWSDLNDVCPYCNQAVSVETVQKTKAELAKERGQSRCEYEILQHKEESELFNVNTQQIYVNTIKQDKKAKQISLEALKKQEVGLEKQILEAQITFENLIKTLTAAESETNPYLEQITEHKASLKELQRKTTSVKEQVSKTLTEQKNIGWWVKGFKDLRLWVTRLALDTLAAVTNQTLTRLGLAKWSLEFDIERQTAKGTISRGLIVTVKNQLTDERQPIEVWSGGELQRLKLGTTWGLAFLVESYSGFGFYILLLDEPSIYLSPTGLNQLLEFLHDEAHQTQKAIYVIDHHSLESPFFDGTIQLVKTNYGSTISDNS